MIFHPLHAHRLKRPETHVKCDLAGLDTALAQRLESSFREVESCRGGSDRASNLGIDRLVGLAILCLIGASNVGRQRNMPQAVDRILDRAFARFQAHPAHAIFAPTNNFCLQFSRAEEKYLAGSHLSARVD